MDDKLERNLILEEIYAERERQDAKFGPIKDIPDFDPVLVKRVADGITDFKNLHQRLAEEYEIPTEERAKFLCDLSAERKEQNMMRILIEEVCEVLGAAGDQEALREELIQVAAVCVKWAEIIALRKNENRQ